jgi:hypothetical protein
MDLSLLYSDIILLNIVILFILCTIIQLIYLWLVNGRLAFYRKESGIQTRQPVSVILSGRDITPGMEDNLDKILKQDYPDFEVVIVNESPDEDNRLYLETLARKYPKLKIINIGENLNFFKGLKFPLSIGIKSSKNDIIIITDIYSIPKSSKWIESIQSNFNQKTDIVLGFSTYPHKIGLFNQWLRFDNLQTSVRYLSFALLGMPYMGVGRNLSYRKTLFYKSHGFTSHYTLITGEDDLFVNQVAQKDSTRIEISEDSHTIFEGKIGFLEWLIQRKMHLETQMYFKLRHRVILGLNSVSLLLFYSAFAILLIYAPAFWILFLSVFGVRTISSMFITKKCMMKLNEKELLLLSPVYELLLLIIIIFLRLSIIFIKSNKWK